MSGARRTSRSWAGAGCALLAVASVAALGVFLFMGQRIAHSVREQLSDPVLLLARARTNLGATVLPAGYEPSLSVTVPLLGHVVVLEASRGEAGPPDLFLCLRRRGDGSSTPREGELDTLLSVRGLAMRPGETAARGALTLDGQRIVFDTVRAEILERPTERWPALVARIDVRCADTARPGHLAVWIVRDRLPVADGEPREPDGTPADPKAIRAFLSAFRLCG